MKNIDHNYWIGKYIGKDADEVNPDLRIAMQQLYGGKGFDFGRVRDIFFDDDKTNNYRPDGYSTYTSLAGDPLSENYLGQMPFRPETVEKNRELSGRCRHLASTIAGEWFFPCHKLNGNTINQCRGNRHGLKDMV